MSSIAISLAAATPFCPNITNLTGGSLPNSNRLLLLSLAAIKDLQLVFFLENLMVFISRVIYRISQNMILIDIQIILSRL
jgi:hypothetical protein